MSAISDIATRIRWRARSRHLSALERHMVIYRDVTRRYDDEPRIQVRVVSATSGDLVSVFYIAQTQDCMGGPQLRFEVTSSGWAVFRVAQQLWAALLLEPATLAELVPLLDRIGAVEERSA